MTNTITNILGSDTLPKEIVNNLQEAFDNRVAEVEASLRAEFAERFEHDKAQIIEGLNKMVTSIANKYETEKISEMRKLSEARKKYIAEAKKTKAASKKAIKENIETSRKFVSERLREEVISLREQKAAIAESAKKMAEDLEETKKQLREATATRLQKFENFAINQLKKELVEFQQDKRALVHARAKVVAEGRKKIKETQARFIKEAAKKVYKITTESLSKEMKQLHEDLERNRQNMFGRRIFETFASEYMTSYLAEGTEIRKLQNILAETTKENQALSKKLQESSKTSEELARKARLAEDRAVRVKIMSELLSNLKGEKRSLMEGMLETTKTVELKAAFNKLLPVVLNETSGKKTPTSTEKKVLNETRMVSGDRSNRMFEPVESSDDELAEVIRLAGISKK